MIMYQLAETNEATLFSLDPREYLEPSDDQCLGGNTQELRIN